MRRAVLLLGVLGALSASAYVLPAGSILRRMAAARGEAESSAFKVEGSLSFQGPAAQEAAAALGVGSERGELETKGTLWMKLPGRCRLEVVAPEGKPVAVVVANGRKRLVGAEVPALSVALQQACALLAVQTNGRADLEQHLRSVGLESRGTSLARFDGLVTYVIGELEGGGPQLWVYKDSFRPARLRYTEAGGSAWEVRMMDYDSAASAEGMPRALEVWRNGQRLVRFTALQADTRSPVADTLFNP